MKRKAWLLALMPLVTLALYLSWSWYYVPWSYMAPYRQMVRQHASEAQVVAQEGRPHWVIMDDVDLKHWLREHRPASTVPDRVESKVLVWAADPYHNSEGYVVYVFFDERNRAKAVSLAL